MKLFTIFLLTSCSLLVCSCSQEKFKISHVDIDNFWSAYDKIISTTDTTEQRQYLEKYFIAPASLGQKKMFELRNYTPEDYLTIIEKYPQFWNSLRTNSLDYTNNNKKIQKGLRKLSKVYPHETKTPIYYTVGAFRSPGTGIKDFVMLGSEYALGNLETKTGEFVGNMDNVVAYHTIDASKHLESLSIHEYVHSLQNEPVYDLLSQCLYEGIGELIGTELSQTPSPWPAFEYGDKNTDFVFDEFEKDMFDTRNMGNWFWNDKNNVFGQRDVGYFAGYKMVKTYYDQATDKKQAIRDLIELNYEDEDQVERIVDKTGLLSTSLDELYSKYEAARPAVMGIKQFDNGSMVVDPSTKLVTIQFSEPMDPNRRGFDFGPLGKEHAMMISKYIGFSADSTEVSFEVDLKPGRKYQLQLPSKFMAKSGYYTKPYLIDFHTKE